MKTKFLIMLSVIILSASPTLAARGGKLMKTGDNANNMKEMSSMNSYSNKMFSSIDLNGDSKISLEEFEKHSKIIFNKLDTNSDGYLESDEMKGPGKFPKGKMKKSDY